MSGAVSASGWISHRAVVSSASATMGAMLTPDGSTPAAAERRHESSMGARMRTPSPRFDRSQPPLTNRSQARLTSRARCAGAVATSMANHGFDI